VVFCVSKPFEPAAAAAGDVFFLLLLLKLYYMDLRGKSM
jgi:hypothetical protein